MTSLCPSVFSVSLWWTTSENARHRDTENTEVAQK